MKKIKLLIRSITMMFLVLVMIAFCAPGVEAAEGTITVGVKGYYIADAQAALDRINEIRKEACEEGVLNPATEQPLTSADYVPLEWSADLEEIARIRAREASIHLDHSRPNGTGWYVLRGSNGSRTYAEDLAWNWSKRVVYGIEQWYAEKYDWVHQTEGAVTGHYYSMINPNYRYVGLGCFYSADSNYPNTLAGELSYSVNGSSVAGEGTAEQIWPVEVASENYEGIQIKNSANEQIQALKLKEKETADLQVRANLNLEEIDTRYNYYGLATMIDPAVTWTSSANEVAEVSAEGKITAKKGGRAVITAECGGKTASITLTVTHTEVTLPAVKATCTKTGLTEGRCCSDCGEVIKAQEVVPALGHTWDAGTVTKKATTEAEGLKTFTCTVCHATKTEVIPKLTTPAETKPAETKPEAPHVHTWDNGKVTKAATTKKKGERTYTCTSCGETRTEEIPCLEEGKPVEPKDAVSADDAEKKVVTMKGDEAPDGAGFGLLQLRYTKISKNQINLKWTKVKGANGYIVYGNLCGSKFKKIADLSASKVKLTVKKLAKTRIKSGKYYKFFVTATANYNGEKKAIANSKTIHVATTGGKYGNYKSVKLSNVKKNALKLNKGKSFTIKATAVKASGKLTVKKHRGLAYESSDTKIASVSKKGVIKARKKGKRVIYVYTQSGTFAKIALTVS